MRTTITQRTVRPPGSRRKTCPCGCRRPWFVAPAGAVYDHQAATRPVRFFARHLRHTKGVFAGQPFTPELWEEWHILRPLFGVLNPDTGTRWYSDGIVSVARKNGKSALAAGIAAYLLVADGEAGPEIYGLAGSTKQAGLVFREARLMMQGSPLLRRMANFYKGVIEVPENAGIYQVMSSRADLSHGTNPHGGIIDEFWVHRDDELREAMQTGTGARAQPLMVTISTVPRERVGPMWELLRPRLFPDPDNDAPLDPHTYFWHVGAGPDDSISDRRVWRAANPGSWVSMEFLDKQFQKLPPRSFEQFHLNRIPKVLGGAGGSWLPHLRLWDDCNAEPVIDPDRPCVVGVDAAPKRDLTAVVLGQVDDDGIVNVKAWTWAADPDLGYLDFSLVEEFLRQLARDFAVDRIVVDPFAMARSMQILAAEGLPVEDFPQSHARMVPASMGLRDLVVDKRLRHGGDPALTSAAAAAATQTTTYGWRLVKTKSEGKIDALIALAMVTRILDLDDAPGTSPTVLVV